MGTTCPWASVCIPSIQLHPNGCHQSPKKTQSKAYIDISDNLRKLQLNLDLHKEEKRKEGCAWKFKTLSFPQIVY